MPMGTYTKIKVIMLYTLNNAEYLAYMNSVLALLPPPSGGEEDRPDELSLDKEVQASGAPDIGLSKEFVNAMEKNVLALADVVDESRISQETEKAELHEKNRDNLVVYITTRISRAGTLPLEAERDAGKYLQGHQALYRHRPSPGSTGKCQDTRAFDRFEKGRKHLLRGDARTGGLFGRTRKGEQRLYQPDEPTDTEPGSQQEGKRCGSARADRRIL